MMSNWPEKVYGISWSHEEISGRRFEENLADPEVTYIRSDLALPDDLKVELNFLLLNYECIMKNCYFSDSATQTIVGPDPSHLIRIRAAIKRLNGVKS